MRDMADVQLEWSEHIQHLLIKLAVLVGRGPWRFKTFTIVTSKISDHR